MHSELKDQLDASNLMVRNLISQVETAVEEKIVAQNLVSTLTKVNKELEQKISK